MLDIWHLPYIHEKIGEPVLPNNFQNGSISIREAALYSIRKATTRAIARGLEPCLSIPKSIAYGTEQMIQTNVVAGPLRLEKQKPWGTI